MSTTVHNVAYLDPIPAEQLEYLQSLANEYDLKLHAPSPENPDDVSFLRTCEGVIVQRRPVTDALIAAAPDLKVIQKMGGRRDRIDVKAAKARGIKVALMSLPGSVAVAEHVMALILACAKKIVQSHELTVDGTYRELGIEPKITTERSHGFQWMKIPGLQELAGTTLGIIGFGDIGTEIAKRAKAFDMQVVYYNWHRLDEELERELGVQYAKMEDLLRTSDFVSLNTPLTPQTEKMIGEAEFSLMKPDAYLINASRGGVIDEAALVNAIKTKQIAGAGLDVFLQEPVPFDHPYLSLENVTLTPHIGGGKGGARERQPRAIFANLNRFFNGKSLVGEID